MQISTDKAKCGNCKQEISTKGEYTRNINQHLRFKYAPIPVHRTEKGTETSHTALTKATVSADSLPSTSKQSMAVEKHIVIKEYSQPLVS